nr:EOG090X07SU [Lepidurus arcticus]
MALPLNPTTSTSVVNAVVEFKTPIGALPPRRKRKVLDEDTYVQRMAEIIQRDFFPDLEKLQVQNEYLEALEANDIHKLREIHSKYSLGKRPATDRPDASPATFDTPLFSNNDSDESRIPDNISVSNMHVKKKSVAGSESGKMEESLDLFLAKYTSEDNESFEEIVEEAEKKRRFKYAWLYNNEEEKKQMNDAALALPSIEEQAIEGKRPAQIDTWKYNTKNYIMYVPDGAPLTAEEKMALVLEKQVITHRNTRYNSLPWDDKRQKQVLKQAASLQAKCSLGGKVDVDGKEMQIPSTPSVNGFSFMKTPSPAPGVEDTPFMTWGEIEGTPFRLDGSDTPLITHSSSNPALQASKNGKNKTSCIQLGTSAGSTRRNPANWSRSLKTCSTVNVPKKNKNRKVKKLNPIILTEMSFTFQHLSTPHPILHFSGKTNSTRSDQRTFQCMTEESYETNSIVLTTSSPTTSADNQAKPYRELLKNKKRAQLE